MELAPDLATGTATDIVPLRALHPDSRDLAGSKAANLAALLRARFPVPDGFVVTTTAFHGFLTANGLNAGASPVSITAAPLPGGLAEALFAAADALGEMPFAVRSSGVAEDLAGASFAGQYETVLDVRGHDALEAALKTCWASAFNGRVAAYHSSPEAIPEMAVLVMQMVPADVAGVAFSANPVTGNREEVVISAVRGLGERLVSGEAIPEEWVVRGREATRRRSVENTLVAEQALAVADLVRGAQEHFGAPQDVEWAIAGGRVSMLQSRPMTALPEPVEWKSPLPGFWTRIFRLGEWLPEPVTSLFESWLLTGIELGHAAASTRSLGFDAAPPYHVIVNGWYFYSQTGTAKPTAMLKGVVRHPRFFKAFVRSWSNPEVADRAIVSPLALTWHEDVLPRYRSLVESCEAREDTASLQDLASMIDEMASFVGEYLESITIVGGFAWKVETALAKFYRQYLAEKVGRSPQDLVCGLPQTFPDYPPHAVQSLDWFRPTLGELPRSEADPKALQARRRRMEEDRATTEAACRAALAGEPKLLKRFENLRRLAQHYAMVREEQISWFTLAWPLMRRAVVRFGQELVDRGVIQVPDDVFFLTRSELEEVLAGDTTDMRPTVASRQREWERNRRLTPPLSLGKSPMEKLIGGMAEAVRTPGADLDGGSIRGVPASPGRATGPVRIVRGPDEFDLFQPGEVLVAQTTAPAWTPLFDRAAAVVTDAGSIAAHASLVAREYGIPAVVGTADASARLRDGEIVTVDGSAGVVELRS
jgi:phosphohistidine swiveling domain-containing protein